MILFYLLFSTQKLVILDDLGVTGKGQSSRTSILAPYSGHIKGRDYEIRPLEEGRKAVQEYPRYDASLGLKGDQDRSTSAEGRARASPRPGLDAVISEYLKERAKDHRAKSDLEENPGAILGSLQERSGNINSGEGKTLENPRYSDQSGTPENGNRGKKLFPASTESSSPKKDPNRKEEHPEARRNRVQGKEAGNPTPKPPQEADKGRENEPPSGIGHERLIDVRKTYPKKEKATSVRVNSNSRTKTSGGVESPKMTYAERKMWESRDRESGIAEDIEKTSMQMEKILGSLEEMRPLVQKTQIDLLNKKNNIKNLNSRKEASRRLMGKLQAEMRILNNEVVKLNKELDEKRMRLESLNEDINLQDRRVKAVEDELSARKSEVENDETKKNEQLGALKRAERSLEQIKGAKESLMKKKAKEYGIQITLQNEIDNASSLDSGG